MEIKSLTLRGYKRLGLSGIHAITIKITKRTLVLIGTNGCGKSSILRHLSPIAALQQHFYKGGCKIFECNHNNNTYSLECHFDGDKPRYLFICNGENLNTGKTLTVYRELVFSHFNITEEIHAVMTGVVTFHGMQVNQRRQWFTSMPGVNYDYAIAYYKRLKDKYKETVTLHTSACDRLIKYNTKLVTDDKLADMQNGVTILKSEIERLLSFKDNNTPTLRELLEYKTNIAKESKSILASYDNLSRSYIKNLDYVAILQNLNSELSIVEARQNDVLKLMETKQIELNDINAPDTDEVKDAQSKIDSIRAGIDVIVNFNIKYLHGCAIDTTTIGWIIKKYYDNLVHVAPNIDTENKFDINKFDSMNFRYKEVTQILIDLDKNILSNQTELNHLLKHKQAEDIVCPNCTHAWKVGYSSVLETTLLNKKDRLIAHLDKHKQELINIESYLHTASEQKVCIETLRNFLKELSCTHLSLSELEMYSCIVDHPMLVIDFMNDLKRDIEYVQRLKVLEADLNKYKYIVKLNNEQASLRKDKLRKELQELETKYNGLYDDKQNIRRNISSVEKDKDTDDKILKIKDSLQWLNMYSVCVKRGFKRDIINANINKLVNEMKSIISTIEYTLMNATLQKELVVRTQKEIEELESRAKLLKSSMEYLSPTDGLIAHGLQSFLSTFMQEVNSFLANVVSYPLEVTCETPSGDNIDLDFRFEIKSDGKEISPDAVEISAGQKELISLSFMLVSMIHKNLKGYPIYLDEFGAHLDHVHKQTALKAIMDIVSHDEDRQVIMVSHFVGAYGALANAQFVVLHEENVIIPEHLIRNEGVTIEYV